jgi:hypothetical protein
MEAGGSWSVFKYAATAAFWYSGIDEMFENPPPEANPEILVDTAPSTPEATHVTLLPLAGLQ